MSQGAVYQTGQQPGWNTTSDDYHDHLSKLSKMHSVMHDVPQYPSVHKAFNNQVIQEEEIQVPQDRVNKKNHTRSPKKVQVIEQPQVIKQDKNGKAEDIEETVDNEADGFIQKKHKGFELCKWKTFRFP